MVLLSKTEAKSININVLQPLSKTGRDSGSILSWIFPHRCKVLHTWNMRYSAALLCWINLQGSALTWSHCSWRNEDAVRLGYSKTNWQPCLYYPFCRTCGHTISLFMSCITLLNICFLLSASVARQAQLVLSSVYL